MERGKGIPKVREVNTTEEARGWDRLYGNKKKGYKNGVLFHMRNVSNVACH